MASGQRPPLRGIVVQALVLLGIASLLGFFAYNAAANMARHRLPFGFGFLQRTAGFDIPFSLITWSPDDTFGRAIIVGLLNTLLVFSLAIVLATVLGFVFGLMRLSANGLIRASASTYVEVIRNTPVLIQVIFVYMLLVQNAPAPRQSLSLGGIAFLSTRGLAFPGLVLGSYGAWALASLIAIGIVALLLRRRYRERGPGRAWRIAIRTGLQLLALAAVAVLVSDAQIDRVVKTAFGFRGGNTLTPELLALVLGLSVYFSAFIAEIVRAGFRSVAAGQVEAARALALTRLQVLRFVTIPLAFRVMIPPLTSQYVNLLKGTSLGVAIAFPDVVQVIIGSILNRTGQAIESMGLTMGIFLFLGALIAYAMGRLNRAFRLVTR